MAEGDATVYNHFKEILLIDPVDLVNDTIKVVLLDSLYTVSADGNPGYATVDSREINPTGYNAGGCTLAGNAVTQRDTVDIPFSGELQGYWSFPNEVGRASGVRLSDQKRSLQVRSGRNLVAKHDPLFR
jgi:hypothetical protein